MASIAVLKTMVSATISRRMAGLSGSSFVARNSWFVLTTQLKNLKNCSLTVSTASTNRFKTLGAHKTLPAHRLAGAHKPKTLGAHRLAPVHKLDVHYSVRREPH